MCFAPPTHTCCAILIVNFSWHFIWHPRGCSLYSRFFIHKCLKIIRFIHMTQLFFRNNLLSAGLRTRVRCEAEAHPQACESASAAQRITKNVACAIE